MDTLRTTLELTGDHIIEEVAEGESITDPGVLAEQNTNGNLSFYIQNQHGVTINRVLNFPLEESDFNEATAMPKLVFDKEGRMLLCSAQNIQQDDLFYGRLYMVQNLETEQAFLKVLGLLLLAANMIGGCAALLAGKLTGRKMLGPIDQMMIAARRIDEKNLSERLDVPEPDDELRSLALTINGMLDRVSAAYNQQGRFVADVSHELRTPLAVMQGNVDLLARWGGEDETVRQDCIAALGRQTDYMGKLVENLLFLARCDNSKQTMNPTAFSVKEIFNELLEEQSLVDDDHVYQMHVTQPDLILTADRAMIKQLLRTLIDNSVKYTPVNGHICLMCTQRESDIVLTVSDDGKGMDEDHLAHIFERFYRIDQARARATGGMGLGLSIASAIVTAHAGSINAESAVDKGTKVTIVLPQKTIQKGKAYYE